MKRIIDTVIYAARLLIMSSIQYCHGTLWHTRRTPLIMYVNVI